MQFPQLRLRRLRAHPAVRHLTQENRVSVYDLVYPMFVSPGEGLEKEVPSMPGVFTYSVDTLLAEIREIKDLNIPAILLFGTPQKKDERGSEAWSEEGTVQKAVARIKDEHPDLYVITDVCMCAYTTHGHCGLLDGERIDNDASLKALAKIALSHARAGADMVAPSDMMDGRVAAIRKKLDDEGFHRTALMSYSVKYASAFYGPFREAAHSTPQFGDRRSYQLNPANVLEALREVEQDISEGADVVMVKPGLPYLDVIRAVSEMCDLPVAAYNVSGEYSMIKAAAQLDMLDEEDAMMESLLALKRAGASIIITYFAKDAAKVMKNGGE